LRDEAGASLYASVKAEDSTDNSLLIGRQGFVEQKQYDALAANCSDLYLEGNSGPRLFFRKVELLTLKVSDVDLLAGTVRLRTSKNGDPRQLNLTQETRQLLAACVAGKGPEEVVFMRYSPVGALPC
jgi:integrase